MNLLLLLLLQWTAPDASVELHGRLVAMGGAPLAGLGRVEWTRADGTKGDRDLPIGEDGVFRAELDGASGTRVTLRCESDGFQPAERDFDPASASSLSDLTIVLWPQGEKVARGRIVDPGGAPVAGALLARLERLPDGALRTGSGVRVACGPTSAASRGDLAALVAASSSFEYRACGNGDAHASLWCQGREVGSRKDSPDGEAIVAVDAAAVVASFGSIEVARGSSAPAHVAEVAIAAREPLGRAPRLTWRRESVDLPCVFDDLAPGTYDVLVRAGGVALAKAVVTPGGRAKVEIEPHPTVKVRLKLLDAKGDPRRLAAESLRAYTEDGCRIPIHVRVENANDEWPVSVEIPNAFTWFVAPGARASLEPSESRAATLQQEIESPLMIELHGPAAAARTRGVPVGLRLAAIAGPIVLDEQTSSADFDASAVARLPLRLAPGTYALDVDLGRDGMRRVEFTHAAVPQIVVVPR